jgi:hypothetical protein
LGKSQRPIFNALGVRVTRGTRWSLWLSNVVCKTAFPLVFDLTNRVRTFAETRRISRMKWGRSKSPHGRVPKTSGYCWRTYFNGLRPTFLHGIFQALYVRRSCIRGEISGSSEFANSIPPFLGQSHLSRKQPFFATAPFSHQTTRSDFSEGFGVLTARRVRDITSPSSRRVYHGTDSSPPTPELEVGAVGGSLRGMLSTDRGPCKG